MKNYYEILEVHPKASDDIIKKVYKIKIKQNHPDLFQGEEKKKAEEITKEITEAYDVLSNVVKRNEYDLELKNQEENTSYNKYESIISSLKEENEYLKEVIISKNNMIDNFFNNNQNLSLENTTPYYKNRDEYEKREKTNITNNKNYFNSILYDLKQLVFKLIILFALIFVLLMLVWILTGNNVFKIIF